MSILVIAEHSPHSLSAATLSTIAAAHKIDPSDVHVLIMGSNCDKVASAAILIQGVSKVLVAEHSALQNPVAENITDVVLPLAKGYAHILAPATTFGKNFMPRLAAQLDVGQLSDVMAVESATTFKRPIYAGNAIATIESQDPIKLLTVRTTSFDQVSAQGGKASIEKVIVPMLSTLTTFVSLEESKSDRPELTSARVVVSGGRALQNSENFKLLEALADQLGGAIGASRAAVDAGYVPNDYQVGQTGKVVAPDLYIAIGISGAIQHLAGMKDSRVIVAINTDPDAPIFQIADYGLVADLFDVLPELTKSLVSLKASA